MEKLKQEKFYYGVSSSAFQIEGDDGTQGRGKSIWDTFCEQKGKILNGDNGKVAIDHYNRFEEDVLLIKNLNANAYRFSISWSRLLPDGIGTFNPKGVDFYNRLIDKLLENNITPFPTLFHWDLPQALSEKDGFCSDDYPKWFAEYTELVVKKFGDRAKNFITYNEPINIIHNGYYTGVFAPGYKLGEVKAFIALTNLQESHFLSAKIIHDNVKSSDVGFAMSTFEEYPFTFDKKCVDVAKKKYFERSVLTESVDMYLDPLMLGKFPERLQKDYSVVYNEIVKRDIFKQFEKMDFLGINNYGGYPVDIDGNYVQRDLPSNRISDIGVPIDSNGLYWSCKFLEERYKLPLYITENGLCNNDVCSLDEKVHDERRVEYLKEHLCIVEKLQNEGCDLKGYFVWTLSDNFEWLFGYTKRFGLVYVDYKTLKRIPKDSYYWYQNYIKTHLK